MKCSGALPPVVVSFVELVALVTLGTCTPPGALGPGQGGAGAGALRPCDPLAPKPIALGAIVGVGRDTDGTLYVDAASGVFVSDGAGALRRQAAVGTGQSGTSEFIITFGPAGGAPSTWRNLLVETTGGKASAMALGPAGSKAFLGDAPPGLTHLTLADATSVAGMTVVNTGSEISYVADVANGGLLVATAPVNKDSSSSTGDLSIFYGPATSVAQRAITSFQQSRSGNGTLTFLVDGVSTELAFGQVDAPDAGPFGVFALLGLTPAGGAPLALTLRTPTPTGVPAGATFSCLP